MANRYSFIKKISQWYFGKNVLPYWVILLMDTAIVFISAVFTYWVTNRTMMAFENRFSMLYTALLFAALSWVGAKVFKTYSGVLRYSSSIDLAKLAYANLTTLVLAVASYYLFRWTGVEWLCAIKPLETIVVFTISSALMWASRLVVRILYDSSKEDTPAMRVLIYGALTGGVGLAQFIRTQSPQQFELAGFISHEPRIKSMKLLGVKVYTLDGDIAEAIRTERIQAVLVSPFRINNFRQNQELQDLLINAGCKIFMAHEIQESSVQDGKLTDEQLQLHEVSVEDLLPRQEIKVDMKSVGDLLAGKRVLITGAAGSIGSEMVRQVATFKPAKMMLIDQAETPQHDIELMMARDFPEVPCEVVVTSISRRTRMEYIFDSFRPEYVFHAAAYKHVPMMENNPSEAVMNNIYGTKVIADMSVKYGVKKFVMISTDKAVNPTNVMGCSKRICEIYVQSLAKKLAKEAKEKGSSSTDYTQFVTTRFGNVLGSNGSVIPLFKQQIKNGGPVTVTDERIVRFFMLIPEACKLVLEAGTMGNGGEIFVFDMGEPVKIADLAKRMIALSGAKNIEIKYTGLREGEKLYEEVLNELEGTKPTFHEKIRIAQVREYDYEQVEKDIDELVEIAKQFDNMATVKKMKEIVPEYKSNNSVYEKLDK
ncbi:nucleoside-diphosphate sugar epimerase/dehydratase [Prevotella sp. P6B1]|uniref:polysaccharide biosynthesis protein n=1 Tax=Prevotella sp. P6B1 TaxID=1410613 RepID=UPI00051BCEA7|nr:nucleoside-diphosphate sugar epimerase/dehydratase [Prevotella sp. P6B1]